MGQTRPSLPLNAFLTVLALCLLPAKATLAAKESPSAINVGQQIAFDVKKGNCLACHEMAGGDSEGTVGPALISMSSRFSDRNKLKQQIWDARVNNPHSIMPPFGKHGILSNEEIDRLLEYLYTL